jgi:hypothetical protein
MKYNYLPTGVPMQADEGRRQLTKTNNGQQQRCNHGPRTA